MDAPGRPLAGTRLSDPVPGHSPGRDASFCCLLSISYMTVAVYVVNAAAGMVKWDTSALHLLSPASLGSSRLVTRAVLVRTNTRRFFSETGQWPVLV